jgi:hypothetical protein
MEEAKGCPTRRRHGQGITIGTKMTIRITIGLTIAITIGSHF